MTTLPLASATLELGATEPTRRDGANVRYGRFLASTHAEGPGRRAALWLQGCAVRCPGCFNPQLWADRGGTVAGTAEVGAQFVSQALAAGAEGVTLLGGEPFDQAEAAASIAEAFRDAGLTVMTFSGYTAERLTAWAEHRPDIARLLSATDLLADGPYLQDRPDTRRPWIGSTNQRLRALTPVYAEALRDIARTGGDDRIEVRIAPGGAVTVNGWASDAALETLLHDLGVRADTPRRREHAP